MRMPYRMPSSPDKICSIPAGLGTVVGVGPGVAAGPLAVDLGSCPTQISTKSACRFDQIWMIRHFQTRAEEMSINSLLFLCYMKLLVYSH